MPDSTLTQANLTVAARTALVAAVTVALVTLSVGAAWAHPFVRGGQAPVDSLAELTLAMAHGCGTEQAGGGEPTLEVAVEFPDGVRVVGAEAPEGWQVGFSDEPTAVIEWQAIEARDPAPDLTFQAVFSGSPGDEIYLKVFQGCDGFSYRWIGTPDEPASDPAIRVVLTEADPDSPPPPVEEPAQEPEPEPEPEPEAAEEPEVVEDPAPPADVPAEDDQEGSGATDDERLDIVTLLVVAVGVAGLAGLVWWLQPSRRRP